MTITHRKDTRTICASQEEVGVSILVEVTGGSTSPITCDGQTSFTGDVAKSAVALITKERRRFAITGDE